MITVEEARRGLVIDTKRLDEELRFQPEIFYEVATRAVTIASERDELKDSKDRTWSSRFISEKMEGKIDGKQLSDKTAETFADVSEEVKEATKKFLEKKKEADEWLVLKESYQQRSVMLKELCGLQNSGNYGEVVRSKEESKYEKLRKEMRTK
jgi:hypothetical protein